MLGLVRPRSPPPNLRRTAWRRLRTLWNRIKRILDGRKRNLLPIRKGRHFRTRRAKSVESRESGVRAYFLRHRLALLQWMRHSRMQRRVIALIVQGCGPSRRNPRGTAPRKSKCRRVRMSPNRRCVGKAGTATNSRRIMRRASR